MTYLPKPKEIRKRTPAVITYDGGREECTDTVAGKREYRKRTTLMWGRQNGLCGICGEWMPFEQATFDHWPNPRGMGGGSRDDRITIKGTPNNRAVHGHCNTLRGSRRDI